MTATPHNVLALSLGVVTGWASGDILTTPHYGAWRFAENASAEQGEIAAGFLDAVSDHCQVYGKPAAVVVSAPLTDAQDVDTAKAQVATIGLTMLARLFAYRRSIRVSIVASDDMRKTMLGGQSLGLWCRGQGYEPKHATTSNALLLFGYARKLAAGT